MKRRQDYLEKIGISAERGIYVILGHTGNVKVVTGLEAGKVLENIDSLVTKELNLYLTIGVADCFPIFFYDPKKKIIALAHAGWRGTVANIVVNTVQAMTNLGSDMADILVGIGPGICVKHFEIKGDVLPRFNQYQFAVQRDGDKITVDLPAIIKQQLREAGIAEFNIAEDNDCTYELPDKYFSYRRDKPAKVQAQVAYIGMRG